MQQPVALLYLPALCAAVAGCPKAPPTVAPITFQCGDRRVDVRFDQDGALLRLNGQEVLLRQGIAASGACYEGALGAQPVQFWTKGNEATLTIGNRTDPTCHKVSA